MFLQALSLTVLATLGRSDKVTNQAREIPLADGYLPPPNTYLPPPNSYLPPSKEYLPPPGEAGGLLPPSTEVGGLSPPSTDAMGLSLPSVGAEGLSPPSNDAMGLSLPSVGAEGLSPPSTGAGGISLPVLGTGIALSQTNPALLSSVVEAESPQKSPAPVPQQSVFLDSASAHPGFCPRSQRTRSCLLVRDAPRECLSDADCGQRQRCCALDCGLQCVDAVVKPSSCDQIVCTKPGEECVDLETGPTCIGHSKSGQCPFHGQYCSNRILVCREDSECEGDKLCCNLGCHRLCVDPVPKEPQLGFCPAAAARPPTRCGSECGSDGDCGTELKCCENACGRICQPGVVPFITCANRNCPSNTRCEMVGLEAVCRAL